MIDHSSPQSVNQEDSCILLDTCTFKSLVWFFKWLSRVDKNNFLRLDAFLAGDFLPELFDSSNISIFDCVSFSIDSFNGDSLAHLYLLLKAVNNYL